MLSIVKYIPDIKPLDYFKNPDDKVRYEYITMIFDGIERKINDFIECIEYTKEEIERIKNKKFWFFEKSRSAKRDKKLKELEITIPYLEKGVEFNEKMYSFLANVLDNPDNFNLIDIVSMICKYKLNKE